MAKQSGDHDRFPAEALDRIAAQFPGRLGLYIEDLATGANHEYGAGHRLPTASICKIPVMIELFRQAEAGLLSLSERRRLSGDISTHGTGLLALLEDEPELTLYDYCRLMIGVSDNMATDLLLDVVGVSSVNTTLDALGFVNTRTSMTMGRCHYLMAGMVDQPCTRQNDEILLEHIRAGRIDPSSLPFQDGPQNNVTAPREMGAILGQLYRGQIVSAPASAAMISLLKGCQHRAMIPRHIAPDVAIAHKHGSSSRIKGDVGIVFLPTGPLIIAALALASRGADGNAGADAIAEISRLTVAALSPESTNQD
ncbi:MAG: hypothetical protein CL878_12435 [Dehalococcoidia bacterium]|nr:hypothetical protein [Dehalococcoidia bacterium]